MGKTRNELLRELDSEELTYWQAFFTRIQPFPEDRADLRSGIVASAIQLPWTKRGHNPPPPKVFMPDFDGKTKSQPLQSEAEMRANFRRAMAGFAKRKKPAPQPLTPNP